MDVKDKRDIMAAILINKIMGDRVALLESDDPQRVESARDTFGMVIRSVYKLVDLMLDEGNGRAK